MSNFEPTERIIAVPAEAVGTMFPDLLAQYGQELPDAGRTILTIGGHYDDAQKTRIRAASLTDGTITGQPLIDGRLAFRCLWQADLAAAFDAGEINGVEQLTEEQLSTLIPQPEVSL
ncbi:MAG: hypothetical protein EBR82_52930 [Caulobacteraceae bacterium]|nr:hypothetical protein [Caulobacteraceae bacterium]